MPLVALDIPKIGLVMENARLVRWLKGVGDRVTQGEPLLELETEKSVVEVESTTSGRLVQLLLEVDQEVHVGDQVAWIESDADAPGVAASGSTSPASSAVASSQRPAEARLVSAADVVAMKAPVGHAGGASTRISSSPVARRLAAQGGVNLRDVVATGPRGRVQLSDVQRAIHGRAVSPAQAAVPAASGRALSSMRRALARSMTFSNATVPQFRVEHAVDWTQIRTIRAGLAVAASNDNERPSVNDFLLQAIGRALLAHPALNATFRGDPDAADCMLLPASGAHVGLVVAVTDGVLVPVIHDVERHSLRELAQLRAAAVGRARQGKLRREDLEGATFSLSNLGASGPDRFDAIINPPQSAILAVGRQRDTVVARNGSVEIRPLSNLTLTVDHRVADGRLAADFLRSLVDILEGDQWQLN